LTSEFVKAACRSPHKYTAQQSRWTRCDKISTKVLEIWGDKAQKFSTLTISKTWQF